MVASGQSSTPHGGEALGDGEHAPPEEPKAAVLAGDEVRRRWWRVIEWVAIGAVVVLGGVAQASSGGGWLVLGVVLTALIGMVALVWVARNRQSRHSPSPILDQEAVDHRFKANVVSLGAQQGSPAWVVPRQEGFSLVGRMGTPGHDSIHYEDLACMSRVRLTWVIVGHHLVRIVGRNGSSLLIGARESDLDRLMAAAADQGVPLHEPETMSGFSRAFGRGRKLDLERHALCLAEGSTMPGSPEPEAG